MNIKEHWDEVYKENPREELGWYEAVSQPSLSLIEKYMENRTDFLFDAGCGESTLIQELLKKGYKNISGADLSQQAVDFLKNTLEIPEGAHVTLEAADLTAPLNLQKKLNLWHDRAVFHFLQDVSQKEAYRQNLENLLTPGGIFIISCFSKENKAEKCSGLPVVKYDASELSDFFGKSFQLLETLNYDYKMPWGDIRNFVYCVFIKKAESEYFLKDGSTVSVHPVTEKEAEDVLEYMLQIGKESDFLSFGSEGPLLTLEQEREHLKSLEGKKSFMLIFKIRGEIAGVTSLSVRENRERLLHFGILGISCLKKFWGNGLGNVMMEATIREAAGRGIKKINLETRSDNFKAIKLYKKFGFQLEGTVRKNLLIDGVYYDSDIMGLEL